jgi:transposase
MSSILQKAKKEVPPTLTIADLPCVKCSRWTAQRKAAVVRALYEGLLNLPDLLQRYKLSDDEIYEWAQKYRNNGPNGLKATYAGKNAHGKQAKN